MSDTVEQIKERLAIDDVIKPYVKLTRAGKSLRGLCPFHKEKTPSFHVSPERGTWHCFGCGLGGDAFSFIEKVEGVDFKGALKILAEKAGVTLDSRSRSPEDGGRKDRLRAVMNAAMEWYAKKLPGSPAEAYAKKRGLFEETVNRTRLGYAPAAWRELLEALTAHVPAEASAKAGGFTIPEMLGAGLIKEADGKPGTYYDRFRDRLMFPIRDIAGRVVAFTGRTLESGKPESGIQSAKYLNSPETELFHKSDILYGMDDAKDVIRTRGYTMLVEGQMDVLHAHQAGWENAVALSGTALSVKHLSLMKRYSGNLMLVLDADTAGLNASATSARLALSEGLRVKAVRLPEGKDPADLLVENPGEFKERVTAAKPIVEFFLAELSAREKDAHRLLRLVEATVLPLIAAVQSPMERDHFIEITARQLGISTESVRESLVRIPKQGSESGRSSPAPVNAASGRSARESREAQLSAAFYAYPDTPLAERVKTEYSRITEASQLPDVAPSEAALFEAEQLFGEDPTESAADELLRAFEEAVIREAYTESVTQLRRAESAGNAPLIASAQAACAKLSARLARL